VQWATGWRRVQECINSLSRHHSVPLHPTVSLHLTVPVPLHPTVSLHLTVHPAP